MVASMTRAQKLKRSRAQCRLLLCRRLHSVIDSDPVVVEPTARGLLRFLAANPGLKRFVVWRIINYYNPDIAGCPIESLQRLIQSLTNSNADVDGTMSPGHGVSVKEPHREHGRSSIRRKRRRNICESDYGHQQMSSSHHKLMHIENHDN